MCWTIQGLQCALITVSTPFVELVKCFLLDTLVIALGVIIAIAASIARNASYSVVAKVVSCDTCLITRLSHRLTFPIALPVVTQRVSIIVVCRKTELLAAGISSCRTFSITLLVIWYTYSIANSVLSIPATFIATIDVAFFTFFSARLQVCEAFA